MLAASALSESVIGKPIPTARMRLAMVVERGSGISELRRPDESTSTIQVGRLGQKLEQKITILARVGRIAVTLDVVTDVELPVAKHLVQIEERRTQSTSNLPAERRLPAADWSEENYPVPTLGLQCFAPM